MEYSGKSTYQERARWWIISLIALPLLAIEAVMVTFVLMVALNGFPSLPDAFAIIYLVCTGGLIPVLSWLAGFAAKKRSETNPPSLWSTGVVTIIASTVIFPILLVGLTVVLLVSFGMV
jgi:hypothetical protein